MIQMSCWGGQSNITAVFIRTGNLNTQENPKDVHALREGCMNTQREGGRPQVKEGGLKVVANVLSENTPC